MATIRVQLEGDAEFGSRNSLTSQRVIRYAFVKTIYVPHRLAIPRPIRTHESLLPITQHRSVFDRRDYSVKPEGSGQMGKVTPKRVTIPTS